MKRIVYLTPDNVVRIVFDYNAFITSYQNEIEKITVPFNKADPKYKVFLDRIQELSDKTKEIDINLVAKEVGVPLDFYFNRVLYPFVDQGIVSVYDIRNKNYVPVYNCRDYGFQAGPLAGWGGKDYQLADGLVFLRNTWKS